MTQGLKKFWVLILVALFAFGQPVLISCKPKPKYGQSKSMKKRKRKLKRKYKKSGIDDCPVFDCRVYPFFSDLIVSV